MKRKNLLALGHLDAEAAKPHSSACEIKTMYLGSTGMAVICCGRRFIVIEKDLKYFKVASKHIFEAKLE